MAEPTIIQEQREVARAIKALADTHLREETDAEHRLRLDREAADQALNQAREAAGGELRRAFSALQDAARLVQPRGERASLNDIVPAAPPTLFDTDLLVGMRITTAQMEARLVRIRSSFTDGSSSSLITAGIIVGSIIAAGSILVMPFVAGSGGSSWSLGWFGAMISPLLLAVIVAAARATIFRPYSPDEDFDFMRRSMSHLLYLHQILMEEARSTHDRRLNERQQRFDETRERVAQSFRQQLSLLSPSIASYASAAQTLAPEWDSPAWRTWAPSNLMPHILCVGEMQSGIREDRLTLPALVPFPHEKSLIIKTDRHARPRALAGIQSMLLRLIATVPSADLQFILIDPVGRGQNVAPFLPFADRGIGLNEGRAWTEPLQIEQRLHDLVNMVESASEMHAYQQLLPRLDASRANGVAEPCRVLVMLDFPTNVDGATARLLSTLILKGPSRSVHPIVLVDTDQSAPYGINMAELEQAATTISWDGRNFTWQDSDFRTSWIEFDKPPKAPLAKQIIQRSSRMTMQPVARSA